MVRYSFSMSELGNDVVKSARMRIEMPFRHHFKPDNLCEYGRNTADACMERGMDALGYDCSGLAVASLCEVLNISTRDWPRELRHTQQLAKLATEDDFAPGDFRLFYSPNGRIHIGVAMAGQEVIHASGKTNVVEESLVMDPSGSFEAVKVVALESLRRVLKMYA